MKHSGRLRPIGSHCWSRRDDGGGMQGRCPERRYPHIQREPSVRNWPSKCVPSPEAVGRWPGSGLPVRPYPCRSVPECLGVSGGGLGGVEGGGGDNGGGGDGDGDDGDGDDGDGDDGDGDDGGGGDGGDSIAPVFSPEPEPDSEPELTSSRARQCSSAEAPANASARISSF